MAGLALLSVWDKTGLVELARQLVEQFQFELLSSGGTAKILVEAGFTVTKVSDYTNSPEILGGRVKTLHPKIHGGILARRDQASDLEDLAEFGISPIDLVVVNLYPFEQTIAQPQVTLTSAIEQIDIGGVALLRAAAKNFNYTTVLCDPSSYQNYLTEMQETQGNPREEFRYAQAVAAFTQTSGYDQAIASYLSSLTSGLPTQYSLTGTLKQSLRYGENPQQQAGWYQVGSKPQGWAASQQLQGKELSYNNLVDLEAARGIIAEFPPSEAPCAAIIKHTNPCGVAIGDTLLQAYQKALAADSISAFGGIVALNTLIDAATAEALTQTFLECVVAPGADPEAITLLKSKGKLRVMILPDLDLNPSYCLTAIAGGFLLQTPDHKAESQETWQIVTPQQPTQGQITDLLFAWRVSKRVKSNAIVVAKAGATLGIGAGQMNRVGSVALALHQAGEQAVGAVLASDGFFPFDDSVRTARASGITAIIQPGGSIRDQDSIKAAVELGMVMVFTGTRHFLH